MVAQNPRPGSPGARTLLGWATVALLAAGVLWHLLATIQAARLSSEDYERSMAASEALRDYGFVFPVLQLLAAAALVVGAVTLGRRAGGWASHLSVVAAVAVSIDQVFSMWGWTANLSASTVSSGSLLFDLYAIAAFRIGLLVTFLVGVGAAGIAALLAQADAARARRASALYAGILAVGGLLMIGAPWFGSLQGWGLFLLVKGPFVAAALVLVHQLVTTAPLAGGEEPDRAVECAEEWERVAAGLSLYGTALLWRLGTTAGALVILFMAAGMRSPGTAKVILVLSPLVALILSVAMLVGVARYARQPAASPARVAAWFGFAAMCGAMALDAVGFKFLLDLLLVDPNDFSALYSVRDKAEQAQRLGLYAMGVGFGALLLLLISFHQLASFLGRRDLDRRVAMVAVLLVAGAAGLTWLRGHLATARGGAAEIAALGAFALVAAVTIVVIYLRLVAAVAKAVRDQGGREIPEARLL